MPKELVGPWDELVKREDLRGRRVRVIVEDVPPQPVHDEWVRQLYEIARLGVRAGDNINVSRDSIYTGTADDPR